MSVEQLAQHFNVELPVLLEAMTRINYFVWNQRRAHGIEGPEITFLVKLPPPSGQVIRTYSDADTMLQFMGVIDLTWDNLVFLFHMAGGNPAPGALRGRGRGRGAVTVLPGPGGRCPGGHSALATLPGLVGRDLGGRGALAAMPGPTGRGPGGRGALTALPVSPPAKPPEHHGLIAHDQLELAKSPEHHDLLGHDQLDLESRQSTTASWAMRPQPTGPSKAARAPRPPGQRPPGPGKTATAPRHGLGHKEHMEQDYLCPQQTKS
ncbi:hypothetical protein Tco_1043938 [Tanacetum coccineum]|uniref:Uncharacterized protein n=1 Tax=Tanacetum coccineum TaxID=301880 RepID=A0ABQ5GR15_9ASTR